LRQILGNAKQATNVREWVSVVFYCVDDFVPYGDALMGCPVASGRAATE
jgi:hypothetical protein